MRFPPISLDSTNVVFFVPKKNRMCNEPFPPCPTITCKRPPLHSGTCTVTNLNPYYQVSWEGSGFTKREN